MKDAHNIEAVADEAIEKLIGDISNLPDSAKSKIHQVYQTFYDAYLKIGELKQSLPNSEDWDATEFDPEIIEYMQHFFSDYQNIYRDFQAVNRHAKTLIKIDPNNNPEEFKLRINALLLGKSDFTEQFVMEEILKGD